MGFNYSFKQIGLFFKNLTSYFRDVLLLHALMFFVVLPFLSNITTFILKKGNVAYLSYDNILTIMRQNPLVFIALVLLFLLIQGTLFFEFTFLLLSIYFIQKKTYISLKQLVKATFLQLQKLRLSTFLFILFYFILVLPISGVSFYSELLAKIKIPTFILDFIFENRVSLISLTLFLYLTLIYLAIRLSFALPEIIFNNRSFVEAIKKSWQNTRKQLFHVLWYFFLINSGIALLSLGGYLVIFFLQRAIETNFSNYSLISAVIGMTLLQILFVVTLTLSTASIFFITLAVMNKQQLLPVSPFWFVPEGQKSPPWSTLKIMLSSLIAVCLGLSVGFYNMDYLRHATLSKPAIISHRGVDDSNGVQNSIEALRVTAKEKPAYVEMDIQETKDHQFVVFHDANLKNLAGINKQPQDMTLAELTNITISENGQNAKICSFDDYLANAKSSNQKLLIEIKTSAKDSPDLVTRFIEKYRQTILSNHYLIQTLNFKTATTLKEKEPQFKVGYILPFSLAGPPLSNLNFYTIEYTTLSRHFVTAAHLDGKEVFAWTVNDGVTATRMMFYGVDGLITDNIHELNQSIDQELDSPTYSNKLSHFIIGTGIG